MSTNFINYLNNTVLFAEVSKCDIDLNIDYQSDVKKYMINRLVENLISQNLIEFKVEEDADNIKITGRFV